MNIQGYTPSIVAPVQASTAHSAATTAKASSASSSSSSSSTGNSASSLQSTFLNLLVTELQNQDPTSPVDPTQMVSQMVSLNQLDQLISINQTLSSMSTTPTSSATSSSKQPSANAMENAMAVGNGTSPTGSNPISSIAGSLLQIPGELTGAGIPKAIMNLYSGLTSATSTSNSTHTGGR